MRCSTYLPIFALVLATACSGSAPGSGAEGLAYRVPAIAYSPYHGEAGQGCPTAADIQADFKRMGGIANTVRIYGLRDCSQGESAMSAATALEMRVNLGLWLQALPADDPNTTPPAAELQVLGTLLDTYGPAAVSAITVGNETQRTPAVPASVVVDTISQVRTLLSQKGMQIPVTTAQIESDWPPELMNAVDFLMPNIHPYWAGVEEPKAADYVVAQVRLLATQSGKDVILGETGWPTGGDVQGKAIPSTDNAANYLSSFVCAAQAANITYTYFESFDVTTSPEQPQVEAHWGLMNGESQLKTQIPSAIYCDSTHTK